MSGLADGEWHRLHPATPLLRGGVAVIVLIGIVVGQLRERIVDWAVGAPDVGGDPIDALIRHGLVPIAIGVAAVVILLCVVGFYFSWRMHTFRITGNELEVRSGLLIRTHRRGKLDRIQAIDITRPVFARLFGAARLVVRVAGNDGDIQLAYLNGRVADALRSDLLRLASGVRASEGVAAPPSGGSSVSAILDQRVQEFIAPELDPTLAAPDQVIRMHPGRVIGSALLGRGLISFLVFLVIAIVLVVNGLGIAVVGILIPYLIGFVSVTWRRITRNLRYTVAATPDGLRIGSGILSTSNETLPPGRVHAIQLSQPLLWRPFGWWEVRVNLASRGRQQGRDQRSPSSLLPVGTREEALKVLEFVLPHLPLDVLVMGLGKGSQEDAFTHAPRRTAWLHPFAWRRTGFILDDDAVILRRGAFERELVVVPTARIQSVSIEQGPIDRAMRTAGFQVHPVHGPVGARLDAVDAQDAVAAFERIAAVAVTAAHADGTQRWRLGQDGAPA